MRQEYFKLLFTAPKKGECSFQPFAEIMTRFLSKGRTNTARNMVITEDFTASEVDNIINRMIHNLEIIRKEAHKKFGSI